MIKQDESILGQPIFQNPGVPTPSNELGTAKPVFNSNQAGNAEYIFDTVDQRHASMPQRQITPFPMTDQNGDGIITQGDVVTAKIEGYKE